MKRNRNAILTAAGMAAAAALLAAPFAADAHEVREVDGYEMVVGFLDEPAFAGDKNGLDLRVTELAAAAATPAAGADADEEETGAPVEGLDETLEAEVIFGDQTMALPLDAAYNDPGAYESFFFPTTPGDYTFRIYGTIDGTEVDESFTSSPEGFGAVQDPAPLQFPKEAQAATERTAGLMAGGGAIGSLATGLGAAGAAAGLAALVRRGGRGS